MSAHPLPPPPAILRTAQLWSRPCDPSELIRISKYNTGEPHFGHSGSNRFDAPGCAKKAAELSACYLGYTLSVAIAESILHEETPVDGEFPIATGILQNHFVVRFTGAPLFLADLTGAALKRLGGHADLTATVDYATTQQWSLAIHENPHKFDGFIYMSRHLNTAKAVILFNRSHSKIKMISAIALTSYPGFARAAKFLGITDPKTTALK